MSWSQHVADLARAREELRAVDTAKLWKLDPPAPPAAEAEIVVAETFLGERFDPDHRAFLEVAGGWPQFNQSIDLFGPRDFAGGARWTKALERLVDIEPVAWECSALPPEDVYPIALASDDPDVFLMMRRASARPGAVIWFAGGEIERFPDFETFFTTMTVHTRRTIDRMREEKWKAS